jgi:DNA-damage-inducible protein D
MSNIVLFEEKQVRRAWNEADRQWHFSIIDVITILAGTDRPRKYWADLKKKLTTEGYTEVSEKIGQLKLQAPDGKLRATDVANAETLLRIIQSIPSPKAEPFKRWLARVGYERLQEIENPELAMARMREIYRAKGYSDAWIEKRLRGIAVRDELTHEWQQRGVKESREYGILTAEISKATFGMTPSQYRRFKTLTKPGDNLRDHMTDLELIFTMLGEASTTEIARNRDAQGFDGNKVVATEGGTVAGSARKDLERRSGKKVSTSDNYLAIPEAEKRRVQELEAQE